MNLTRMLNNTQLSMHLVYFIIGLLMLIAPSSLHASNAIELELPLIINKALTGDISASIVDQIQDDKVTTEVSVPIERFLNLVEPFANQEQISVWLDNANKSATNKPSTSIKLSTLQARGLDISFDASSLSIHALVPRLGIQGVSLSNRGVPKPKDYYRQSSFASGVNVIARNNFNHRSSNITEEGFGDANIDISGFTSFGGFNGLSLFYEGNYIENNEREFARQNITLIHDNFKNGIRYTLGDVRPTTSDLQTSPDLIGFNIERNYQEINPFRNINPNGRSTFTLDRSARVSFEVNGVIVESQNLEPGNYSVRDFPLAAGANDVRVFIDNGTSQQEVANFSTYLDFNLLDAGLNNFGVSAGFLRDVDSGRSRRYQDDPSLLAFYERGINQNLTLGVSIETLKGHRLISTNAIYGTRYGLFAAQAALSQRNGLSTGYSSNLSYNIERNLNSIWSLEADIQANYQNDVFLGITELNPSGKQWSTNARFALTGNAQSLSVNAGLLSNNGAETESVSATYTRTYRGFGLSAGFQYTKINNGQNNNTITLRISKAFGGGRFRTQYRSKDNEYRTEWNSRPSRSAGSFESSIALSNSSLLRSAELNLGYIGSRFELNAQHTTNRARTVGESNASTTNLIFASSAGYADGKFAFGRPFTEGFLIVSPHDNLRGKKIFVNQGSQDGDLITSTKRLGTTLVPLQSSYRPLRYSFSVDDLPLGYDLGSSDVNLYPKFLSGYNLTLGSDAANTVLGKALWPDQTPLNLVSGRLVPDDGTDSLLVFTNKTGRFVAERALYGRYKLVFVKDEVQYTSSIVIDDSNEPGLTQVGTITLTEQL